MYLLQKIGDFPASHVSLLEAKLFKPKNHDWSFNPDVPSLRNKALLRAYLGDGFKYILFSPLFGEDSNFWLIFFKGVETTN